MQTTLCVLTLNEIDSIKVIMPQVNKTLFDQILIIDGGSTDGTIQWCEQQGYEIYVQKQRGLRQAYLEALPHIRGDLMITFSPDGNSLTSVLPALINELKKGYDMVIVSRYLGSAKSEDDSMITRFGNWMFTTLINLLHGGHYTDAMVIYRGYKKSLFYDLELIDDKAFKMPEKLFCTRISIEPLLSVRAARAKLKVSEIPGDEPKRIGGERKLQIIRWGLAFLYQIFFELFNKKSKPVDTSLGQDKF
ncbi:MAG: histidinol-phosphate phosphatase family protein [Gammaproteobacteria bacterium]|jgi:glycosyltransferase involved in cell wall biosynthesis|nr:histidinol-phosphate phosphatase family protein [Gammaproteobacteria bacterium]